MTENRADASAAGKPAVCQKARIRADRSDTDLVGHRVLPVGGRRAAHDHVVTFRERCSEKGNK